MSQKNLKMQNNIYSLLKIMKPPIASSSANVSPVPTYNSSALRIRPKNFNQNKNSNIGQVLAHSQSNFQFSDNYYQVKIKNEKENTQSDKTVIKDKARNLQTDRQINYHGNSFKSYIKHENNNNSSKSQIKANIPRKQKINKQKKLYCINHRQRIAKYYSYSNGIQTFQNQLINNYQNLKLFFCQSCALMVASKGFKIEKMIDQYQYYYKTSNEDLPLTLKKINSQNNNRSQNRFFHQGQKSKSSHKRTNKIKRVIENVWNTVNQRQKYSTSIIQNLQTQLNRHISQINLFFLEVQKCLDGQKQELLESVENQKTQLFSLKEDISSLFKSLIQKTEILQQNLLEISSQNKNLNQNHQFNQQNWLLQVQKIEKTASQVEMGKINFTPYKLRDVKQVCSVFKKLILNQSSQNSSIRKTYQSHAINTEDNQKISTNTFRERLKNQNCPMIQSLKACSQIRPGQLNSRKMPISTWKNNNLKSNQNKQTFTLQNYEIKQDQSIDIHQSKASSNFNMSGFLFQKGNQSSYLLEFK